MPRARATLHELTVGQVADRSGVAISALHFYERKGLIAQLQSLRDDLTECIGCGCLTLRVCHLTNPRDVLGREGPGARRLPQPRN